MTNYCWNGWLCRRRVRTMVWVLWSWWEGKVVSLPCMHRWQVGKSMSAWSPRYSTQPIKISVLKAAFMKQMWMTNSNSCETVGEVHFGGTWGHATAHSVFVGDERQSCDLCSWRCRPGEASLQSNHLPEPKLCICNAFFFGTCKLFMLVIIISILTCAVCSGSDGQPLKRHWCVWKSSSGRHWRSPHKRGPTANRL